jgi:Domain of unknown function (DUF1840)
MLFKFKSKAAGDLIMLEPNGRRVLEIIGKDAGPQGIILPEHMHVAVADLTAAFAAEEADQQAAINQARAQGGALPSFDAVNLRKRAGTFVDMLQRCAKENAPITWGA